MKLNKLLMASRICEVRKSLFCATLPFLLSTTGAYAQMMGGPPPTMNLHGAPSSIPSQPTSTTGTTINSAPSSTSGQGSQGACHTDLDSCKKAANQMLTALMAGCSRYTTPDSKKMCETSALDFFKNTDPMGTCNRNFARCIAAVGIKSGQTYIGQGPNCDGMKKIVQDYKDRMLIVAGKGALASTADAISTIVAVTSKPAHGTPLPDSPPDGSMGGPNQTVDGFKSELEQLAIELGAARQACASICGSRGPCP